MARGGKRPGAGRKPKAEKRAEPPVKAAENKLRDRLPELVDVALSLAIEGKDAKMVIYCIDRVLGKPTQPIDVLDTVRQLAVARNLDPERVVNLYEIIKRRRVAS